MKVPEFDGRAGTKSPGPGHPREWTADEINFMMKWIPVFGYAPVAAALGVGHENVRLAAQRFEIGLPEKMTSFCEIARMLGISPETARKDYKNGMNKLAKMLEDCR